MLIGVMGAIVTLLVIAGMILMTPGNTEYSSDETAGSRTREQPPPPHREGTASQVEVSRSAVIAPRNCE